MQAFCACASCELGKENRVGVKPYVVPKDVGNFGGLVARLTVCRAPLPVDTGARRASPGFSRGRPPDESDRDARYFCNTREARDKKKK